MDKRVAIAATIITILLLGFIGLAWRLAVTSQRMILPGVTVMGVDVSRMSAEEAADKLRSELPSPEAIQAPLQADTQTWHLKWSEVGQRYRIDEMVEAALEFSRRTPWQQRVLLTLGFRDAARPQQRDIPPDVTPADPTQIAARLEEIAAQVDTPPVDARLQIDPDGQLHARDGQVGQRLDLAVSVEQVQKALRESVAFAHLRELAPIPLSIASIPPMRAAPEPAYSEARILLAKPFTLIVNDPLTGEPPVGYQAVFTAPVETLAGWLALYPTPTHIELTIDRAAVSAWLEHVAPQVGEARILDQPATLDEMLIALETPVHQARAHIHHPTQVYTVQPGDTLFDIAYQFGFPQWHLEQANPEVEPGLLNVGQQLTIPSIDVLFPHPIPPDKRIEIDLPTQRMHVFEQGQQVLTLTVSSGISSTPTIAGQFQILFKEAEAVAQRWNLEMPYFMGIYEEAEGFYNGIHELPITAWGTRLSSGVLGWPASFGCIIVDEDEAQALFEWAEVGTLVRIHGVAPGTPMWLQTLGDLTPLTPAEGE